MINSLYKLYKNSNSTRTPLEDFNTECFKGVLEFNPELSKKFIKKFLKLPDGNYSIRTQVRYNLKDDPNCIIDMVLESSTTVCFIENKVNSKEGWEQLARYIKVLEEIGGKYHKKTYLMYCTKYEDKKQNVEHHFRQFKWRDIGFWLDKNYPKDNFVINYTSFLKKQNIMPDTLVTTDTVISLKNFLKTYESMDIHIKNAEKHFKYYFPKSDVQKQEKIPKIREHDRIARLISNVLENKSVHTEILYSIHFEGVRLQSQIWIHKTHPQCDLILLKAKELNYFDSAEKNEWGALMKFNKGLYHFIDNDDAEIEIEKWFKESFKMIAQFIAITPEFKCSIKPKIEVE